MAAVNFLSTPQQRNRVYFAASLLLALLFATALRVSLLLIYPLVVAGLFYFYEWKLDKKILYVGGTVLLFWLLSLRNGWHLRYHLVSLYFFIPMILLLFAKPVITQRTGNYLSLLMTALGAVVLVNNLIGLIQYIRYPNDDSFSGIYGTFTVSQNGLSLLNGLLFYYHLTLFRNAGQKPDLWLAILFLICCVMGFYGAGLMIILVATVLSYLKISVRNVLQLFIITAAVLAIVYFFMKNISPLTLDYNLNIIDRFLHGEGSLMPRKLIAFKNYITAYSSNLTDALFGSGPGTFNSRTAFMVGSPSYFHLDWIKSDVQPYYFREYAYTLWNVTNTGPYDGFMNQPFSSFLALLGEYGLIVTAVLLVWMTAGLRSVRLSESGQPDKAVSAFRFYRFLLWLTAGLLLIDNYMEYPEIIGLVLTLMILSKQQLLLNVVKTPV